jgi:hypothetical protein
MDEAKPETHLTSAAAFVEGGIQQACDDSCSICLEDFSESDPSTVIHFMTHLLYPRLCQPPPAPLLFWKLMHYFNLLIFRNELLILFYPFRCRWLLANMNFTFNASLNGIIRVIFNCWISCVTFLFDIIHSLRPLLLCIFQLLIIILYLCLLLNAYICLKNQWNRFCLIYFPPLSLINRWCLVIQLVKLDFR